ncbi:MAG: hypothetical protein L0I76_13395 [Pseudonocardia sp.]|nr:hypothetical protein [Pseudonocardia sp.]
MNNRVLTAARLNVVDARMRLGIPWLVAGAAFLVNLMIYALVRATTTDTDAGETGALAAMYFTMAAAYLATMTQTFPFALSLGVTRRNFYSGTGLVVLLESLLHSVVLTVLLAIEQATGGWGLNMQFFGIAFLVQSNPFLQVIAYMVPMVALSFLGLLIGTLFRRWGQTGLYLSGVASTLVVGGLIALVTWQQWWGAVGEFFTTTPTLALTAAYPLLLAVVFAAGGFLLVRRATP